MAWVPGGTFRMGSSGSTRRRRRCGRSSRRLLDRPAPGDRARVPRFVRETGYGTVAETRRRPGGVPGRGPRAAGPRLAGLHPARAPGAARRLPGAGGATCPGAAGATREGPAQHADSREPHPGHPRRLRRRRRVRRLGGQGAAHRGRVGVRGPRRARRRDVRLGRRGSAPRADDGQHLAGRLPPAQRAAPRATTAPPPSGRSRRTATDWSTWRATSGSGPPTTPAATPPRPAPPGRAARCGPAWGRPPPGGRGASAPRRKVIKGGSHLCAPNYCLRYRPAARQAETMDTPPATSAFGASAARPASDAEVGQAGAFRHVCTPLPPRHGRLSSRSASPRPTPGIDHRRVAARVRRAVRRLGEPPAAGHRQLDGHQHQAARERRHPRPALHLPGGPAVLERGREGHDRGGPAPARRPAGGARRGRAPPARRNRRWTSCCSAPGRSRSGSS